MRKLPIHFNNAMPGGPALFVAVAELDGDPNESNEIQIEAGATNHIMIPEENAVGIFVPVIQGVNPWEKLQKCFKNIINTFLESTSGVAAQNLSSDAMDVLKFEMFDPAKPPAGAGLSLSKYLINHCEKDDFDHVLYVTGAENGIINISVYPYGRDSEALDFEVIENFLVPKINKSPEEQQPNDQQQIED